MKECHRDKELKEWEYTKVNDGILKKTWIIYFTQFNDFISVLILLGMEATMNITRKNEEAFE